MEELRCIAANNPSTHRVRTGQFSYFDSAKMKIRPACAPEKQPVFRAIPTL
jgi:hypothetical protein